VKLPASASLPLALVAKLQAPAAFGFQVTAMQRVDYALVFVYEDRQSRARQGGQETQGELQPFRAHEAAS
jgi:hypothetical protein